MHLISGSQHFFGPVELGAGLTATQTADGTTLLTATVGGSVDWANITNKPATFPPSAHSHVKADLPATIAYEDELNAFSQTQSFGAGVSIISQGEVHLAQVGGVIRWKVGGTGAEHATLRADVENNALTFETAGSERFRLRGGYTTYTVDGVWSADARPHWFQTPSGATLRIGYHDASSGQYVPSLGFAAFATNYNGGLLTIQNRVIGNAYNQFQISHDGIFGWGSGSSAPDVSLYRSSANVLRTDSNLVAAGYLYVGNNIGMNAGQAIYFDWNTHVHTFIYEAADNDVRIYAGGNPALSVTAAGGGLTVYNGWFRNNEPDQGLYNNNLGYYWYASGGYWLSRSANGIRLQTSAGSTNKGYLYFDTSDNFGLLDLNGNWMISIQASITAHYVRAGASNAFAFNASRVGMSLQPGTRAMDEWHTGERVIELSVGSAIMADASSMHIMHGMYYGPTSDALWRHAWNGAGMIQVFSAGNLYWYSTVAGTTGNAVISLPLRMVLYNDGQLHLGFTTPQGYTFAVNGSGSFNSAVRAEGFFLLAGGNGAVNILSGGPSNIGYIEWRTPAGVRMGYMGFGSANIGLNLENGAHFTVTGGNVYAPAYFTSSALRYKKNLQAFNDYEALRILTAKEQRVYSYELIGHEDLGRRVGLIADYADSLLVDKNRDSADLYGALALCIGAIRALNQGMHVREAAA